MRKTVFGFVVVLAILPILAAADALPKVSQPWPKPGTKNYADQLIVLDLDRETNQKFKIALKPAAQLFCRQSAGNARIWVYSSPGTIKPGQTYKVTVTSPQSFVWQGKTVKKLEWSYTTATKNLINPPPPPGLKWSADDPVWTNQAHFRVAPPNRRQEKQYDFIVTIYATSNAGVNAPPIAEQRRRYQRELQDYTKEAIAHLKKNRVDIPKSRILWIPEEARAIAKALTTPKPRPSRGHPAAKRTSRSRRPA